MTPSTKSRLKSLGLTARLFAQMTGTYHVRVAEWGKQYSGRSEAMQEPAWVPLLLHAWEMCPEALQEAVKGIEGVG